MMDREVQFFFLSFWFLNHYDLSLLIIMDLIQTILTRRSIRKYDAKIVPQDKLNSILQAAMAAPSANNQQPWEFIIIEAQQLRDRIEDIHPYATMTKNAPVAILICGDLREPAPSAKWIQDCSAACQNILLATLKKNI